MTMETGSGEQCHSLVSYQPRIALLKSSLWWRAALNRKCQWCSWASSRTVLSTPWRSQTSSVEKRTKRPSKMVPVPFVDYNCIRHCLLDGSPMTGRNSILEAFHVWILGLLHCQDSACQYLFCQAICPAMRPSQTPDTCAKSFSKGLGRRPYNIMHDLKHNVDGQVLMSINPKTSQLHEQGSWLSTSSSEAWSNQIKQCL